ncbi:zf-HC2 domain-containing protein [Micromonospora parathelypteridis]|uniref:Zf-HC2 domain-containing protein n=1 Tax=Micromonospora parathelypteridis TaxID=1839617 RepID=A0A840W4H3_9ACTN|nr:zf-HC2 domain-containing protein [Micromonospora parathelypteridis]MBB5480934.1 hypothetical protein [Micromonospora parathelypteridis]GGO20890.1 hypothetical protein GCM10011576_38670 [Micromonospora parathelypteridis]
MTWHLLDEDLRAYATRTLVAPALWSTEAHLAACGECRERLAATAALDMGWVVDGGWARLDAALDAPRPGPVERLMIMAGVPDHTARLLAATPALRLSWLVAIAVTATLTATVAVFTDPVVFLVVAPLLPLVAVAMSFAPGIDPTYEIAVVAPIRSFRLLLLRCLAVLSATTALSAVASLFIYEYGLRATGWFLPSLALTVLSLLLSTRLGAGPAAVVVGVGWATVVAATLGDRLVFTLAGQAGVAVVGGIAAVALSRQRGAYDRYHVPNPIRRAS